MTHASLAKAALTFALLLAPLAQADDKPVLGKPLAAQPGDFALKIETGAVIPLTTPQSSLFMVGGAQTVKALFTITPYLDVGPSVSFAALSSASSGANPGTAWSFGGSVRLKRPHHTADNDVMLGISPWLDVDALYVRTGPLNRPGFAAAVGASIPLGKDRIFWIGPFARYSHIIQLDRPGYDNHDGKLLTFGLSLEVGGGIEREREVLVAEAPVETRTVNTNTVTYSCPDRDQDTIPDAIDRCPDVPGPMDSFGCPPEPKKQPSSRLELKQRPHFAWDAALLDEATVHELDGVVTSLRENESYTVQISGYASSEGSHDHNQTLSRRRADAVRNYLVAHGIKKERLVSKGFSSSDPRDTNETEAGRSNNRRVEFVVNTNIVASRNSP